MTRFEEYGNIMIDLETLSTHTNAAIIEIGAVEFNKYTGKVGKKFNVIIEPSEWCKNGRHVDGETLQWWLGQPNKSRNRFVYEQENTDYCSTLKEALEELKNFILHCGMSVEGDIIVWGNGSTMDITILQSAYEYFNLKTPWKYWSVNDVRTIVDLNPKIKEQYEEESESDGRIRHSAIDDCLYQIKYLSDTIKSLDINKI